jgi:hypothetical protein
MNTEIVGCNPTQDIDVCVYSVFVLGSGFAAGSSPVQGVQEEEDSQIFTFLTFCMWLNSQQYKTYTV